MTSDDDLYIKWVTEPIVHSHVEDCLPDQHPLAFTHVYCFQCGGLVHAGNNECMSAWAETESGPICLHCLSKVLP